MSDSKQTDNTEPKPNINNGAFLAKVELDHPIEVNGNVFKSYRIRLNTLRLARQISNGADPYIVATDLPDDALNLIQGVDCEIIDDIIKEVWQTDEQELAAKKKELVTYL